MRERTFYNYLELRISLGALLFLACAVGSCAIGRLSRIPTDDELERLSPRDILQVYWDAALRGDSATIRKIVVPPRKGLFSECPFGPDDKSDELRGDLANKDIESSDLEPTPNGNGSNVEAILRTARVIEISREPLQKFYQVSEGRIFGNEAKFIVRSNDNPQSSNSLVVFMMRHGTRWSLVDVVYEGNLPILIRNKKFGEPRTCPAESGSTE